MNFEAQLTCTTMAATGVVWTVLTIENASGNCPLLAPAKMRRDCVKIVPLHDPKVEHITKRGMSLPTTPIVLSAKVCKQKE